VTELDLLMELAATLTRVGRKVAVLALTERRPVHDQLLWMAAPNDAAAYAHALYANLRALDEAGCDAILVERPPQGAAWMAINDRLARASAGIPAREET
jgi:L-threonylcarbamoyladenylate synthase